MLAFALACISQSACAGTSARSAGDPSAAVQRFLTAIRDQKLEVAYASLDPALRAGLSRERFDALARDSQRELNTVLEQLQRVDEAVVVRSKVQTEHGETVTLVLEDGEYHIAGGVLDAHALATPLDAVSELRRALLRGDLRSLLRVLTAERRASWDAAFGDTIARTEDPLDLRVEIRGDQAIVRLTGGGELHLRLEAGEWHIDSAR